MNKRCETISILFALLLLLTALFAAGWMLIPKVYITGTDWSAYKKEAENSIDIFFAGSSMTFCDVIPAVVYESGGVACYDIAGPEQTIPVSYYFIKEACRTQSPKAIFLELGGMFFSRYEEHTVSNITFMPRGTNRLSATLRAANREDIPGIFLPVLEYHSRWHELTWDELRDKLQNAPDLFAGYRLLEEQEVQNSRDDRYVNEDYYDYSLEFLYKISSFCHERGIDLYLYLAPAAKRIPEEFRARLEQDIEEINVQGYFDFSTDAYHEAIGIDDRTDWADGIHLNVHGAEKLSDYLAELLESLGYEPTENADTLLWQRRMEQLRENS